MKFKDSVSYVLSMLNPFVDAICIVDLLFRMGYFPKKEKGT